MWGNRRQETCENNRRICRKLICKAKFHMTTKVNAGTFVVLVQFVLRQEHSG